MSDAPYAAVICGRAAEHPDAPAACHNGRRCAECDAVVLTTQRTEDLIADGHSLMFLCEYCVAWPPDDSNMIEQLRAIATAAATAAAAAAAAEDDALPPRGSLVQVTSGSHTRTAIVAACFAANNLPDLRPLMPHAPAAEILTQHLKETGTTHAALLMVHLDAELLPCPIQKRAGGWYDVEGNSLTITPVPKYRQNPRDN